MKDGLRERGRDVKARGTKAEDLWVDNYSNSHPTGGHSSYF